MTQDRPDTTVMTVGDLHVVLTGNGPALLLLHGNGEDMGYFDHQIAAWAARRTLVAVDSRGHGQSARGSGPLTIARMADDAADVVAAVTAARPDLKAPWDVLGFSDGGNVAIELALRHGQMVRSLVLIGANLDPSGLTAGTRALTVAVGLALAPLALVSKSAQRRREIWMLMVREPQIPPQRLAEIAVPTLILVGSRDVIRHSHSALIAASIPGARLETIPDAPHNLLRQSPTQANQTIEDFLTDKAPATS